MFQTLVNVPSHKGKANIRNSLKAESLIALRIAFGMWLAAIAHKNSRYAAAYMQFCQNVGICLFKWHGVNTKTE